MAPLLAVERSRFIAIKQRQSTSIVFPVGCQHAMLLDLTHTAATIPTNNPKNVTSAKSWPASCPSQDCVVMCVDLQAFLVSSTVHSDPTRSARATPLDFSRASATLFQAPIVGESRKIT